jgi:uncharacterized protein GlcG (DUF336 family)
MSGAPPAAQRIASAELAGAAAGPVAAPRHASEGGYARGSERWHPSAKSGFLRGLTNPNKEHPMAAEVYKTLSPLSLDQARTVVRSGLARGRELNLQPMTVVVLDAGGHIIAAEREDGSGVARIEIARGKAHATLSLGIGGACIASRYKGREAFLGAASDATGGRFIASGGGVLALDGDDRIIGAVGVSGDTPDNDQAVAMAGLEAAGLKAGLDPSAE